MVENTFKEYVVQHTIRSKVVGTKIQHSPYGLQWERRRNFYTSIEKEEQYYTNLETIHILQIRFAALYGCASAFFASIKPLRINSFYLVLTNASKT